MLTQSALRIAYPHFAVAIRAEGICILRHPVSLPDGKGLLVHKHSYWYVPICTEEQPCDALLKGHRGFVEGYYAVKMLNGNVIFTLIDEEGLLKKLSTFVLSQSLVQQVLKALPPRRVHIWSQLYTGTPNTCIIGAPIIEGCSCQVCQLPEDVVIVYGLSRFVVCHRPTGNAEPADIPPKVKDGVDGLWFNL